MTPEQAAIIANVVSAPSFKQYERYAIDWECAYVKHLLSTNKNAPPKTLEQLANTASTLLAVVCALEDAGCDANDFRNLALAITDAANHLAATTDYVPRRPGRFYSEPMNFPKTH